MPLNPTYVQRVSESIVPGGIPGKNYQFKHKNFTNVSSQMADPGQLLNYFQTQNVAYPMPYTNADFPVNQTPITQQVSERNNVSALPLKNTLPEYFKNKLTSKEVRFRTGSMMAWGVPLGMTQLRATDAEY